MFKMLFGANKDIRLILCAFYNIYNVDRVFCRLIDKSKFGKVQGSNIKLCSQITAAHRYMSIVAVAFLVPLELNRAALLSSSWSFL